MRRPEVRRSGALPYLRPDGKTQVTLVYEDGIATALDTVVLSAQHHDGVDLQTLRSDLVSQVIEAVLPPDLDTANARYLVNPTGRFVEGGPAADAGLTGRKIIVDTYGGAAPHGGGAFSGKDPTKVDRSGSYYARYIAKNVVAAGLAKRCQVQLAYAIGVARPVGMYVDTFGTGALPDDRLGDVIQRCFDGRPAALIRTRPAAAMYTPTSSYGHPARVVPWERTDRVEGAHRGGTRGRLERFRGLAAPAPQRSERGPDARSGPDGHGPRVGGQALRTNFPGPGRQRVRLDLAHGANRVGQQEAPWPYATAAA